KRAIAARHKWKAGKAPPRQVREAAKAFAAELGPLPLQNPALSRWFLQLGRILRRERASLQRELNAYTKEKIRKAIDRVNDNQMRNPRAFFESLNLGNKKDYRVQKQSVRKVGNTETVVDEEDEVKQDIRNTWKEIFTSRIAAFPVPQWLKPKFLSRFRNTLGDPTTASKLLARITIEELLDTPLALGTAPGQTGLSNECIKHAPLEVKQELVKLMNQIKEGAPAPKQ